MEEKKDQGLHAEAAGKLPEEALDQVAGGNDYSCEHSHPPEKRRLRVGTDENGNPIYVAIFTP